MDIFDTEESISLAINASYRGDKESAIRLLKYVIDNEPENAQAYFLLGAEYAELQLLHKAISSMQKALQLQPDMMMAVFQLAVIYLYMGDTAAMTQYTQRLTSEMVEGHYFHYFGQGLNALANENFTQALDDLSKGVAVNQENPALNQYVENIVNAVGKINQPNTKSELLQENNKNNNKEIGQLNVSQLLEKYQDWSC
ncbi:tetratricopeptide repeat protein [Cysteiniphilum litorale]|uniref:tetratricopeptide repeat protein n=1 Tax=Cysteiniphilum litorale TaxID=2056700 RepID=UPI003F8817C8